METFCTITQALCQIDSLINGMAELSPEISDNIEPKFKYCPVISLNVEAIIFDL